MTFDLDFGYFLPKNKRRMKSKTHAFLLDLSHLLRIFFKIRQLAQMRGMGGYDAHTVSNLILNFE